MLKEYKSTAVIISKHSIHSGRFCRQRHIFAIDVKLKRQKWLFYDLVRPLQWTSSPKDGALEPLSRHWWQRFIFPCVCVARCRATSGVLTCNYSEKCRNLFHTESRDFWLVHNCFPIFPSDPLWFPPSAALIAGSKWHARPQPPLQRGAARLLSLCVCLCVWVGGFVGLRPRICSVDRGQTGRDPVEEAGLIGLVAINQHACPAPNWPLQTHEDVNDRRILG